ncbi:hypothetical protein IJG44_07330 [bacterium]|nr:hypothetical protein [bacterium]
MNLGTTFLEVVSNCPTNWRLSPIKTLDFVENNMLKYYPLGVKKDVTATEEK